MWFTNSYDRYDFAFGETRNLSSSSLVKVHHSLVRDRARSSHARARSRSNQWKRSWIAFVLQPAFRRRGPRSIRLLGPFRLGPRVPDASSGAEETRTPDFLLAKEALYQLSYGPTRRCRVQPSAPDPVGLPRPSRSPRLSASGRFWTRTRDLCLIRAVL
jgi:hypothetical protein